jgi:hypothetical protein
MMRQIKQPTFAELYAPKLITVLREGYGFADFRADVIAGLTVAIVALPLSMAIAIASGVTPDRGLYTAVIGGFIVSLLGRRRSPASFFQNWRRWRAGCTPPIFRRSSSPPSASSSSSCSGNCGRPGPAF